MFSIVAVPIYVPTCSLLLLNLMVGVEKGREVRGWKRPELKSTHIYIQFLQAMADIKN